MGAKLTKKQLELYERLDEILFYKWDPIGINSDCLGRDEYRSYLPKIFQLVLEGESPESVAAHLTELAKTSMGLSSQSEHDLAVAKIMIGVREYLEL
ncbi:hypothetical protein MNKW57_30810 [Biformimicrobium ophioploci]|uniref:Uncharacterized protein n=1 Tax=Biformimicrobium ophioploci TaxID=3036711 RepID=A0ABQ6M385_9GAMM|nr:hypothetical protein MNKW57_30810 [Microbulbifer sp. NKW57]